MRALNTADGPDLYQGGAGSDTVSFSLRGVTAPVVVVVDDVANDGGSVGGEGDNVATDVETVLGGKGKDTLDGGAGLLKNTFKGGPGDDDLHGGPANDRLYGNAGADELFGDAGKDVLDSRDGIDGNDHLSGGADTDTCYHDAGDTVLDC